MDHMCGSSETAPQGRWIPADFRPRLPSVPSDVSSALVVLSYLDGDAMMTCWAAGRMWQIISILC